MSASYQESRLFLEAHPSAEIVGEAAAVLGFGVLESSDGYVRLRVPLSWSSWGENITVVIATIDGHSLVEVASTCKFFGQVADWGKNRENVKKLYCAISDTLGSDGACEIISLCSQCGYTAAGLRSKTCPECGTDFQDGETSGPRPQLALRTSAYWAACFTAVEALALFVLDAVGWNSWMPPPARNILGQVAFLAFLNFPTVFFMFWASGLVARWRERRDPPRDSDS